MEETRVTDKTEAPARTPRVEEANADEFKKRMLNWTNPVEFVNNMYGSHPADGEGDDGGDGGGGEYFKTVFGK